MTRRSGKFAAAAGIAAVLCLRASAAWAFELPTFSVTDLYANLLSSCSRLITALAPFYGTIKLMTALVGFIIIGMSLQSIYRRSQEHRGNGAGIGGLITGALLISFMPFIDMASRSLFNKSAPTSLPTANTVMAGGTLAPMVNLAVVIVMLVGFFQVAKGIVMLKQNSEGAARFWPAVTHIVGGVLCVNIQTLMYMLGNTFGGTLQTTILTLLGSADL